MAPPKKRVHSLVGTDNNPQPLSGNPHTPSQEFTAAPKESGSKRLKLSFQAKSRNDSAVGFEHLKNGLNGSDSEDDDDTLADEEVEDGSLAGENQNTRGRFTDNYSFKVGFDQSLPPLHKLPDIFEHLTKKALHLGDVSFRNWINWRTIDIGTMCSGTESPLLSLNLIKECM
jgi:hypothetical protein